MELFSQLEWLNVSALLRGALLEDLGQGDITTAADGQRRDKRDGRVSS